MEAKKDSWSKIGVCPNYKHHMYFLLYLKRKPALAEYKSALYEILLDY
jgi:hypothetical protein